MKWLKDHAGWIVGVIGLIAAAGSWLVTTGGQVAKVSDIALRYEPMRLAQENLRDRVTKIEATRDTARVSQLEQQASAHETRLALLEQANKAHAKDSSAVSERLDALTELMGDVRLQLGALVQQQQRRRK